MAELRLNGIASRPLAGYLKAIGLLRIISEQADPGARARWDQGRFELRSRFDEGELEDFLLDEYAPTPVLSPWNGRSGFYGTGGGSGASARKSFAAFERTSDERFASYPEAIKCARRSIQMLGLEKAPPLAEKAKLIQELRATVPDSALSWIDAVIVQSGSELHFPPVAGGTGGNDGSGDYSDNFMQAVVETLLERESPHDRQTSLTQLRASLEGGTVRLERQSLGHFFRDASPVSSPSGDASSLGNPWDLMLAIEGTIAFAAGASRKHNSELHGSVVAPFAAQQTATGYGTAASAEDGKAELWMPLWGSWSTAQELSLMLREGRSQVGRRPAHSGLDFVRAAGNLGVARGIDAFERYGILGRSGQVSLSVPLGRVDTGPRPSAEAVEAIAPWFERAFSAARGKDCPTSVEHAARRAEAAIFRFADESTPKAGCDALDALGGLEGALATSGRWSSGKGLRPPARINAEPWIAAADDGSIEFAAARSLASSWDREASLPGMRDYLNGTVRESSWRSAYPEQPKGKLRLRRGLWRARLAEIHTRRHLDAAAASDGVGRAGLSFFQGTPASLETISAVAQARIDGSRMMALAQGLSLLNFGGGRLESPDRQAIALPDPLVSILLLGWQGTEELPGPRPGWAAGLAAGALRRVVDDVVLRLRMADCPPVMDTADLLAADRDGAALSSALLLRPTPSTLRKLRRTLTEPRNPETKPEEATA